jgi:alpha-beta hydrolase superfamily lysophospholipase
MKRYITVVILLGMVLAGCSQKTMLPTDNRVYDSPENYDLKYSDHYFHSSDGTIIEGWWFKAKGEKKGMVVVSNGIIQNMSARFVKWMWVTDAGYDLFLFDYRGYGRSKADPDMYAYVDDVKAGIEYAHALNGEGTMIVCGQSMGGSLVIDAVAQGNYPYISALIIDSTFTDFASAGNRLMARSIILWPWSWLPYVFRLKGMDAIDYVGKIDKPMLFITGTADSVVEPENTLTLFLKADTVKSFWLVEGAGHVRGFDRPEVRQELLKWLEAMANGAELPPSEMRIY